MNRSIGAVLAAALMLTAAAAQADDAPPTTNPIRYTWIVTSCATWNCAAAALVMAGGDKYVITLPTGRDDRPWLILRRVEEGSIYIPPEEPFACEVFDTVDGATNHYDGMDACHAPIVLSVPDGRAVVTSLTDCGGGGGGKRRSVR